MDFKEVDKKIKGMEFSQAPACCQKSIEKIHDIIDAVGCLEEVLALSPMLTKPRAKIGVLGLLWGLATGVWSWRQNRKMTSELLKPIVQNRFNLVIDIEIVSHSMRNDSNLEKYWKNMRKELQIL